MEYLLKIQESYFAFFSQDPVNKYVVIDINSSDFVANNEHYSRLIDIIFEKEYPVGLSYVIFY